MFLLNSGIKDIASVKLPGEMLIYSYGLIVSMNIAQIKLNPAQIKQKLRQLDTHHRIQFIILFGSVAAGKATPLSDVDIAIYYEGTPEERFRFRMTAAGSLPDNVDIQIFQDLPVAVQKEVIGGEVLYCQDFQLMSNEYLRVIQEFDHFEKYQNEYYAVLEAVYAT